MNATETTRVEIDDRIREQPELLRAVNAATEYVLAQAEGIAPPAEIRWAVAVHDPATVELIMTESSEFGGGRATRAFPVWYLQDAVSRDSVALRTFGDLLRTRSIKNLVHIDELISRIDFDGYVRAYAAALRNHPTGN